MYVKFMKYQFATEEHNLSGSSVLSGVVDICTWDFRLTPSSLEMMCRLLPVLLLIAPGLTFDETTIHSDDFIQTINDAQDSWRAGRNFHPGSFVKNLLSALPMREERLPVRRVEVSDSIPDNFDSRITWKLCLSIQKVRDQGNCASAWAMVAAAVFSDRRCVSRVDNVEVSSQNILACCQLCGVNCYGGYLTDALHFLARRGSPSTKCHPYEIFTCPKLRGTANCPAVRTISPRCRVYCRKSYKQRYPNKDFRQAGPAYSVANSSQVIVSEVLSNGPVAAVMDVYEDLFVYKSGVYRRTAGRLLAHHPVRLVGWGEEDGRPYWLVINTWSHTWGDKGVLKVARNDNGVNLENRVFAITAKK